MSQFAVDSPDGLESVASETGITGADPAFGGGIFADYATEGIDNQGLSLAIAGVAGSLITLAVGYGLFSALGDKDSRRKREASLKWVPVTPTPFTSTSTVPCIAWRQRRNWWPRSRSFS